MIIVKATNALVVHNHSAIACQHQEVNTTTVGITVPIVPLRGRHDPPYPNSYTKSPHIFRVSI